MLVGRERERRQSATTTAWPRDYKNIEQLPPQTRINDTSRGSLRSVPGTSKSVGVLWLQTKVLQLRKALQLLCNAVLQRLQENTLEMTSLGRNDGMLQE